jgi:hypothetical protein
MAEGSRPDGEHEMICALEAARSRDARFAAVCERVPGRYKSAAVGVQSADDQPR